MRKFILAFCIVPVLSSCFGPKHLQTKLNRNQYPLGYLHDSPKNDRKTDISISPQVIDNSDTTYLTKVNKDDGHLLYLIFMYDYDYDYTINLGKNSVRPNISEFIRQSFIKESERSGIYKISDTTASKEYKVLIEVSDYNVSSKYHETGSAFGGYQEWQIDVQPSKGNLSMKLIIFDSNDNALFTKEYKSNKTSNYVKSRSKSENEINKNMMQNMTETLAQCIKDNITEIVHDINSTISE